MSVFEKKKIGGNSQYMFEDDNFQDIKLKFRIFSFL